MEKGTGVVEELDDGGWVGRGRVPTLGDDIESAC